MRFGSIKIFLLAATVSCSVATASTITFGGLTAASGTPFPAPYTEANFVVTVTQGFFFVAHNLGNPGPSIYGGPLNAVVNGAVEIKQVGGGTFMVNQFDFLTQNGPTAYSILGNGGTAFTQNGTQAGGVSFTTIASNFSTAVTTLDIDFTPGAFTTSFNIDNIVLTPTSMTIVPETTSLPLLALGLSCIIATSRLRKRILQLP